MFEVETESWRTFGLPGDLCDLDRSPFLSWLGDTLRSKPSQYQVDRLVPRSSSFDLRINILGQPGGWSSKQFRIVSAGRAVSQQAFPLDGWRLVYCDPFHDATIGIATALEPERVPQLSRLLSVDIAEVSLHAYTPGRRATLQYIGKDRSLHFGKIYRSGMAADVFQNARRLSKSAVRGWVAHPVAHIEDLDLVIWRGAPGKLLSAQYGEGEYRRGLCLAGKALRRFHDTYPLHACLSSTSQRRTLLDELKLARKYLDRIELLLRYKPSELAQCLSELEQCVDCMGGFKGRSLHRDYHDNQILINDEHAVILDLDQVGEGDPAIDLGNLLAHIDFRFAYHHCTEDTTPYAEEVLSAYGINSCNAVRRRVAFAHAVSLLRNCCLYVFLPRRLQALTDACRRTIRTLEDEL